MNTIQLSFKSKQLSLFHYNREQCEDAAISLAVLNWLSEGEGTKPGAMTGRGVLWGRGGDGSTVTPHTLKTVHTWEAKRKQSTKAKLN